MPWNGTEWRSPEILPRLASDRLQIEIQSMIYLLLPFHVNANTFRALDSICQLSSIRSLTPLSTLIHSATCPGGAGYRSD